MGVGRGLSGVPMGELTFALPPVRPRLAELREASPLQGLGHLIMAQSYVCALIAMMVRSSTWGPGGSPTVCEEVGPARIS